LRCCQVEGYLTAICDDSFPAEGIEDIARLRCALSVEKQDKVANFTMGSIARSTKGAAIVRKIMNRQPTDSAAPF